LLESNSSTVETNISTASYKSVHWKYYIETVAPEGVMNVVSRREYLASGICQNPLLASNFENTLALVSWARVSSTLGKG